MSRHRNVRTMNYDDEYDGYDDVYGHSVEDDYCISPATAAQFLYNRDAISSLSSYMKEQEIPEEEEEELSDHDEGRDPMTDSAHFQKPILSDDDQARLNSCLEEIRNVIGDSTPDHILIDAVMKHQFNYELALDAVLCQQEPPKPQREPRQRKARSDDEHGSVVHSLSTGGVVSAPFSTTKENTSCVQGNSLGNMSVPEQQLSESPDLRSNTSIGHTSGHVMCDQTNKPPNERLLKNISSLTDLIKQKEAEAKRSLSVIAKENQPSQLSLKAFSDKHTNSMSFSSSLSSAAIKEQGSPKDSSSLSSLANMHQVSNELSALSQSAEKHNSSREKLTSKERNSLNQPPVCLSTLASKDKKTIESGTLLSSLVAEKGNSIQPPPLSLSALAGKHENSNNKPPSLSLSALADKHENSNSKPPSLSLSALADKHENSNSKPPSLSLSALADKHECSKSKPPSLSLSTLAKENRNASSQPPSISLSRLATTDKSTEMNSSTLSLSALSQKHTCKESELQPHLSSLQALADKNNSHLTKQSSISLSGLARKHNSSAVNSSTPSLSALADRHDVNILSVNSKPSGLSSSETSDGSLSAVYGKGRKSTNERSHNNNTSANELTGSIRQPKASNQQSALCLSDALFTNKSSNQSPRSNLAQTPLPVNANLKKSPEHVLIKKTDRDPAYYEAFVHSQSDSLQTMARASFFAEALCYGNSVKPTKTSHTFTKNSKFLYASQAMVTSAPVKCNRTIRPFDFSSPSPDDIVKVKQKSAFTRDGKGASSTNSTNQSHSSSSSQSGSNANASNDVSNLNNDVNRMTFSFMKDSASSRSNHNTQNHKVEEKSTSRASEAKASTSTQNVSSDHVIATVVPTTATEGATAATASESVTATPKKESQGSAAKRRQNALEEYKKRKSEGKDLINLVVIGHVDAGKSTLMGHLLFQLGSVNKRTMHKYEQESKKLGKASFAYAWVLDETEEERSRGVTMDVAQTRFETDNKSIILLDAPGHKDFIPNMITGAAQADVAILVVNATRGEFETGFETGGQTREHAMLIRSLGVSQLVVAVNKMDTVDWSKERYAEVLKKLGHFLKQTGFKEADVNYVPCSGLSGENLAQPPSDKALTSWYSGPTLVQLIDKFKSPERDVDKVLRFCVSDVFKGLGAGFSVAGTLQAGFLQASNKVLVMPHGETANVKGVTMDELPVSYAFAGDTVTLTLTNMDIANVSVGSIICDISSPIRSTTRFLARVVIFTIDLPITKGFPVVLHYQSMSEPAQIRKLISQLHKGTGEVIKKKPRCLVKNTSAIVEIEVNRPVCVELYKDFKDLGRFMLRYGGTTIAAGLVTQILDDKPSKD